MEINSAVENYILKFVKIGSINFFKDFDKTKIKIKKLSKDTYYFSYKDRYIEKNIDNICIVMGIINSKKLIISAQKIIKNNEVTFTIQKTGTYKVEKNEVIYTDKYITIKETKGVNEYTESIEKTQKYEFKTGLKDLIKNYQNLVSKKWPIIKNYKSTKAKKLVKKC